MFAEHAERGNVNRLRAFELRHVEVGGRNHHAVGCERRLVHVGPFGFERQQEVDSALAYHRAYYFFAEANVARNRAAALRHTVNFGFFNVVALFEEKFAENQCRLEHAHSAKTRYTDVCGFIHCYAFIFARLAAASRHGCLRMTSVVSFVANFSSRYDLILSQSRTGLNVSTF